VGREVFQRVRMRKQSLLFSDSYIMDNATNSSSPSPEEEQRARGRRRRRRRAGGHPSLIRSPFFGQGQLLD